MSEPTSYTPLDPEKLVANVPAELRELPVWLLWKAKPQDDGKKPSKLPYYVSGRLRAEGDRLDSPADREQLVLFTQALDAFNHKKHYAGLGVALGPVGESLLLSGIDLDNCIDDDCGVGPGAERIVEAGGGAYTETSPSLHGLKIFGTGNVGTVTEPTHGIEIYSGGRFFTVTGEHYAGDRLAPLDAAAALARELLLNEQQRNRERRKQGEREPIDMTNHADGNRNRAAYAHACSLRARGMDGDPAWQSMLQWNRILQPPMSERELRVIFKSSLKRPLGPPPVTDFLGCHPNIVEELRALSSKVLVLPNDYVTPNVSGRIIFDALGALRQLFTRGGKVVEVVEAKAEADADAAPGLNIVTPDELRSRLSRCGYILKHAIKKPKSEALVLAYKHCSHDNARVLLGTLEAQELLPPIQLVTRAPVLIEHDGKPLVLGPGYHEQGGGVFVCGRKAPSNVPLAEARDALLGLLTEFEFATDADRSRAMAGFIGPALRMGGLVPGNALVNAVEADKPRTGKGYLCELQAAVYGEVAYPIAQREGGVGSLDESFGAALASARSFVLFDNLRDTVASKYLEFALTAPRGLVTVRVPHKGEVTVNISGVSFQLTSNGLAATTDFSNRILLTRLRKRAAGSAFRTFDAGDLLADVRSRQPYHLGCVFAVIREWFEAGRKRNPTSHSFHQWVGALDWIVQNVFRLQPLLDGGHEAAVERVGNPALSWLRQVALAVVKQQKTRRPLQASAVAEIAKGGGIEIPDLHGADDDSARNVAVGRLLGRCFKAGNELQLDDVTVTRSERMEWVGGSQRKDMLVRRYEFRHTSEAALPPRHADVEATAAESEGNGM